MIYDNLYFHNVAELPEATGGGLHLARFPSKVWPCVEAKAGAHTIRSSNGCEIQFVTDKPSIRIFLRALTGKAKIIHLMGNQIVREETLESGKINCLEIYFPTLEMNRAKCVRKLGGYSPNVYRICSIGATLAYHGVDPTGGNVRPPTSGERPSLNWLAYGSSITQSGDTFYSYVNATAQILEATASNLGMGGSCWIEPAVADFIDERNDWDFATFELGINMVDPKRANQSFKGKVYYLLDQITRSHPDKPIFLITIFDHGTYHEIDQSDWQRDVLEKNKILRQAAAKFSQNVTLLEGPALVPDFRGFQVDLLHPEPFAYTRMGIRLAEELEKHLDRRAGIAVNQS